MTQKKVSVSFLSTLCIWLSIIIPSNAIPLNDFTGHSENLSSVVNFAVLPPGDPFTQVLKPFFQGGNGSTSSLNPQQFTYLYQITNHLGPSPFSQLNDFALFRTGQATTVGTFNPPGFRVDFLDQGKVVDATGIRSIDPFAQSGSRFLRRVGDGPGGDLDGAKGFGLAIRQDSSQPRVRVSTNGLGLSTATPLRWEFSGFASGLTSPLFGYQSREGPGLTFAAERFVLGVGETMIVPAATAAAEAASFLVIATGLVGMLWWRKERMRV